MCTRACKLLLARTCVHSAQALSHGSVPFKLKQMSRSPSFQFVFAGLRLLKQLISIMSVLGACLLENRVSAWKVSPFHLDAEAPVPSLPATPCLKPLTLCLSRAPSLPGTQLELGTVTAPQGGRAHLEEGGGPSLPPMCPARWPMGFVLDGMPALLNSHWYLQSPLSGCEMV